MNACSACGEAALLPLFQYRTAMPQAMGQTSKMKMHSKKLKVWDLRKFYSDFNTVCLLCLSCCLLLV